MQGGRLLGPDSPFVSLGMVGWELFEVAVPGQPSVRRRLGRIPTWSTVGWTRVSDVDESSGRYVGVQVASTSEVPTGRLDAGTLTLEVVYGTAPGDPERRTARVTEPGCYE